MIERFCLIHKDVRTFGRKALVVGHVIARHTGADFADDWNRAIRIAQVFIEADIGRGFQGELAGRVEMQFADDCVLGRPRIEAAPLGGSRLEKVSLRWSGVRLGLQPVAFAFEMLHEEWKFDVLAIILAGLRCKVEVAQRVAGTTRPSAVRPRAHYQSVGRTRTIFLQLVEKPYWPRKILGIEPTADEHHGGRDVLPVGYERAAFPEFVITGMLEGGGPVGIGVLQILFVAVRERTHLEVKIVSVGCFKIERYGALRPLRIYSSRLEAGVEAEIGRQIECAIVKGIVTVSNVAHGGLRRHGFQRRMRIDEAERRIKTGIRNAPDPYFTVVVRNVLHQPVNGVVGIGAVVKILRVREMRFVRSNIDERTFGEITSADVLIYENESFLGE